MKQLIFYFFLTSSTLVVYGQCESSNEGDLQLNLSDRTLFINRYLKASWQNAYQSCIERGMKMLTIRSVEENALIVNFLQLNNINNEGIWTGGIHLYENRIFRWISTGEPISTSFWGASEPNNMGNNENCIELQYNTVIENWNDLQCSIQNLYFCEGRRCGCSCDETVEENINNATNVTIIQYDENL